MGRRNQGRRTELVRWARRGDLTDEEKAQHALLEKWLMRPPAEPWETVKRRFAFSCAYCGRHQRSLGADTTLLAIYSQDILTKDHVIPRSRSGESYGNIMPACYPCNTTRGSEHPIAFIFDRGYVLREITATFVIPILVEAGWVW